MKAGTLMLCALMLIASIATQAGAATLVGQWTFDGNGGTGALENKAAGVTWSSFSLNGTGADVSNGSLVLPRYLDTTWKQTSAVSMLKTDLGPSGYFKEMTQVFWLKWPGFDTSTTGNWTSLGGMVKVSTTNYDVMNQTLTKAAQRVVMKATDNNNWYGNRVYETSGTTVGTQWAKNGGSDPPTDRYIKLAQVVKVFDATKYEQVLYWDTGAGLVTVGASNQTLWNAWMMPFGQYDTDCIPFPTGGKRYDAFGLMDYSWSTPQRAGEIDFDEVRVYSGALTAAEIGSLTAMDYVPVPEVPEPGGLAAFAVGAMSLLGFVSRRRR